MLAKTCLRLLLALSLLSAAATAFAQDSEEVPPPTAEAIAAAKAAAEQSEYSRRGADACWKCHNAEESDFPVMSIFRTRHASIGDQRSPFGEGQLQCETCHGPAREHGRRIDEGEVRPPLRGFGKDANTPAAEQNAICLDCHQGKARVAWNGSAHASADVACASCHQVHAEHDPALDRQAETDICISCHSQQKADLYKRSSHPLRHGVMSCSGCHQPHGSPTAPLLAAQTLNQTCFNCHAEKRGPFLWEHAPVAEDCSTCHEPHGSSQPSLLAYRPPILCQQCHSVASRHSSFAPDPTGLATGAPSAFLLAGSCLNCHVQVHGSNHPSGVKLMR